MAHISPVCPGRLAPGLDAAVEAAPDALGCPTLEGAPSPLAPRNSAPGACEPPDVDATFMRSSSDCRFMARSLWGRKDTNT